MFVKTKHLLSEGPGKVFDGSMTILKRGENQAWDKGPDTIRDGNASERQRFFH